MHESTTQCFFQKLLINNLLREKKKAAWFKSIYDRGLCLQEACQRRELTGRWGWQV